MGKKRPILEESNFKGFSISFNVKYFRQKSKLYTDKARKKEINSYIKVM